MHLPSDPPPTSYFSYGLNIDSFIPLPGLLETSTPPDVLVRAGSVSDSAFYNLFPTDRIKYRPEIRLAARVSKDKFCFEWDGLGYCIVENGSLATVELDPQIDPVDFTPFITGPISAVLLNQRGNLVLHASVVKFDGKAVLFMGNKGHGKSTLAAHLTARGYELIGDDLAPVSFDSGLPMITPGHPQLRLSPAALASLGHDPDSFPRVNRGTDKRQFKPTGRFSTEPLGISSIFILESGTELEITDVNRMQQFVEIAKNSYLAPYIDLMENTAQHFQQCNHLANAAPVYRISRPLDFASMDKVTERIEELVLGSAG